MTDLLKLHLKCLHFLFFSEDFAKQKCNPIFAEKYLYLKVKVLVLGCFIPQMSHKSNLSFNFKILSTVRVFSLAFPRAASKEAMKEMLKSPEKIIWLNSLASDFKRIVSSICKLSSCSGSVLELYKLTNK